MKPNTTPKDANKIPQWLPVLFYATGITANMLLIILALNLSAFLHNPIEAMQRAKTWHDHGGQNKYMEPLFDKFYKKM